MVYSLLLFGFGFFPLIFHNLCSCHVTYQLRKCAFLVEYLNVFRVTCSQKLTSTWHFFFFFPNYRIICAGISVVSPGMYNSCHALVLCMWYFEYIIFNPQTPLTPRYNVSQFIVLEDTLSKKIQWSINAVSIPVINKAVLKAWDRGKVFNMGGKLQFWNAEQGLTWIWEYTSVFLSTLASPP